MSVLVALNYMLLYNVVYSLVSFFLLRKVDDDVIWQRQTVPGIYNSVRGKYCGGINRMKLFIELPLVAWTRRFSKQQLVVVGPSCCVAEREVSEYDSPRTEVLKFQDVPTNQDVFFVNK